MGDDLPKQVVYDTLMEFRGRSRYVSANYTNRFWIATPLLYTGVILEDDILVNHAYRT